MTPETMAMPNAPGLARAPLALGSARRLQAWRHMLQAAAGALDRMLPPRPTVQASEVPAGWFKYPPF